MAQFGTWRGCGPGTVRSPRVGPGAGSKRTGISVICGNSTWEPLTRAANALLVNGSRMYPDTGNGGYTSVHTDVDLVYNAATNRFLPGNHVVLTDLATQCLASFSLDFERTSANSSRAPTCPSSR